MEGKIANAEGRKACEGTGVSVQGTRQPEASDTLRIPLALGQILCVCGRGGGGDLHREHKGGG